MTISYNNADLVLTTSAAVVASVGAMSSAIITRLTATNIDTVAHNLTLYRVINGGTASTSNQIISPANWPGTIAAGETIPIPMAGHSLVNGQSLQALADANSVINLSISFTQID